MIILYLFLGCESVVIYYLSSLNINSCNVSLSGKVSIYVDTNKLLSIPANAYNFIVDSSDAVGKISNLSNCDGLLKDLFDAVAEIKDWCNGVALFPHEKFFSSLQFFGKSYRTAMLSFLSSIIHLNFAAKVQKIFGLSKYLHFNFITFPYLFLLIVPYLSRKRVVFVSRSSVAHRLEAQTSIIVISVLPLQFSPHLPLAACNTTASKECGWQCPRYWAS